MKKYIIIFSPTGGTEKVANAITSNWADTETVDLSNTDETSKISLEEGSLALIAMPSFGGIAPQLALERLSRINANGGKCAIVAVYGNRAYEDTLIQMKDYSEKAGFQVIAAISAVAEHSIIRAFAAGRPDADDCNQLSAYGDKILEKAADTSTSVDVPGNRPYKKAGSAMVPKANSTCTSCGSCANSCPSKAIDVSNPRSTDKSKCIGCMRCISICPVKARGISPVMAKVAGLALKKACSVPKGNELFI